MTDSEELRRLAQAATPGPWDFSDSAEAVSCEQRYDGADVVLFNRAMVALNRSMQAVLLADQGGE